MAPPPYDERTLEGPGGSAPAPVRPQDNRGMGVRIMHYRARIVMKTGFVEPVANGHIGHP